jgi:hypothetical protein
MGMSNGRYGEKISNEKIKLEKTISFYRRKLRVSKVEHLLALNPFMANLYVDDCGAPSKLMKLFLIAGGATVARR